MTPEQADAMAALHAEAFGVAGRPWSAAEILALATRPGALSVSEADGLLLGVAAGGEAEVLTLAVRPEARRRGVARRLLRAFAARAAAAGAETAFLEVAADNGPARALYVAEGWRLAGRRRGYYMRSDGPPVDALILRRELEG